MNTNNEFGKRLEKLMNTRGYSNNQLTKELELSKNAIGNYKNNQIPNATILHKLAQKLGTSMEYLLTGRDINTPAHMEISTDEIFVAISERNLMSKEEERDMEENQLINNYRLADRSGQIQILNIAKHEAMRNQKDLGKSSTLETG